MKIVGCDFHPSFQQIAMVDSETGEHTERKLTPDEARQFYAELRGPVLMGMEACGSDYTCDRFLVGLRTERNLGFPPMTVANNPTHNRSGRTR